MYIYLHIYISILYIYICTHKSMLYIYIYIYAADVKVCKHTVPTRNFTSFSTKCTYNIR